jgi:hypothetical protein
MSIGLVLRHTYEETCEICEKIAHFFKIVGKKWNTIFTRIGYARAAAQLANQGYYEEAKALMLEKDNLK